MQRIEQKIKAGQTEEITEPEKEERPAKGAEVIDLMSLLRKSVQGGGKGAKREAKREAEPEKERAHKPRRAARKRRAA
jgi:DNA end-binding protein Ku